MPCSLAHCTPLSSVYVPTVPAQGPAFALLAKSCPGNMVYLESGSPCMDTCSHLEVSSLCEEHRMDGCFCPEGVCGGGRGAGAGGGGAAPMWPPQAGAPRDPGAAVWGVGAATVPEARSGAPFPGECRRPPSIHTGGFGESHWGDTFPVITPWAHVLLPHSRSLEAPRKVVWSQAPTARGGVTGVAQRTRGTCGDSPTFRTPARGCGPTSGSPGVGIPAFRRLADCNVTSRIVQAPCTMTSQAAAASP